MEKIYTLQHVRIESLGVIEKCLKQSELSPEYIKTYNQQSIPKDMSEASGLIILGGPMGVYNEDRFPFLSDEIRLIEQALKEDKPVLGICLGSQLIASALGAKVKKGYRKEIGWYDVLLERQAHTDPLFKGISSPFTAYHWHGDVFDRPRGAVPLAKSNLTATQGFRYGQNTYGLLFHIEVTDIIIRKMLAVFHEEVTEEKIDKKLIEKGIKDFLPQLNLIGLKVFDRWTRLVKS